VETQGKDNSLKPLLDQLRLTIKGVMLLSEQNQEISRLDIVNKLMEDDPEVREFFSTISTGRNQRFLELLITGIGQFITASVLFIFGVLLLFPSLSPSFSIKNFLDYYAGAVTYYARSSGLLYISVMISFLISVFLLVSAFFTIRVAKNSLLIITK
jgi:hypothetical protein